MADQLSYPMRAYAYYMDKGLPPHQAAALASNSAHEGPESTHQQGDSGTALGRFQWRGERQTGLMNYAKENKVDPYADETQWDYALHEMKNGEKDAGDKFLASKNVNEANDAMLQFLRPAGYDPKTGDVSAVPSRSSRLQMASAISNLSPLPDSQAVGTPAAPAMQVADAATATTSAIPGLLTSVLTEKKKQDQQAQTRGLLAAGQPAYTPSPPLQLPGLLALRQLNPNAAMSLPKIGQRGLLG